MEVWTVELDSRVSVPQAEWESSVGDAEKWVLRTFGQL